MTSTTTSDPTGALTRRRLSWFGLLALLVAFTQFDNASLLDALPDLPVPTSAITEALAAGRQER